MNYKKIFFTNQFYPTTLMLKTLCNPHWLTPIQDHSPTQSPDSLSAFTSPLYLSLTCAPVSLTVLALPVHTILSQLCASLMMLVFIPMCSMSSCLSRSSSIHRSAVRHPPLLAQLPHKLLHLSLLQAPIALCFSKLLSGHSAFSARL